jgi:two-component system, cell cycle sensor histidine kinase and response regulator CckA
MKMEATLNILIAEDQPADGKLMLQALRRDGFEVVAHCVDTEADFVAHLHPDLDIILTDYAMPQFDAERALALVKRSNLDVPLIVVTATTSAAVAVEMMKQGAADYLLKERLSRLGEAVRRACHERDLRRAHSEAETALRASREQLAAIVSFAMDDIKRAETERKSLEEQLWRAQRMETIGRLAGGVAHDFNNLLTAIIGYSQMLMARIGPHSNLRRELEEIYKAGTRAASLTSGLLAFSRKRVIQPVSLDLNTVVAEAGKMLRRLISEDIELQFALAEDLGGIKADLGQMQQVVMNLAINARDAMPQGGRLTIATANVEPGELRSGAGPAVAPGAYVALRVSDTGSGMDDETQAHLFESLFTTTEQGQGVGLGMSTIHAIVAQSGGHIKVESESGQGTTFEVYLPRLDESEAPGASGGATDAMLRGTETVLLVEDEEAVRRLACRILKANGYTALEAEHGDAALAIATTYREAIHLLVTDVVMPQMSGRELAEKIISLRPTINVLYISGYMDDAITRAGVLPFGSALLQKPFQPDAFARKVRTALDGGGETRRHGDAATRREEIS